MAIKHFPSIESLKSCLGQEVSVSDWLSVTQPQIDAFADVTDDHQWIHTDPDRAAREAPSGTTVAHGFLTLSLIAPLFAAAIAVANAQVSINYGFNRIRFTSPVLSNDRVRARFTLLDYGELHPGAQITWKVAVERAGGDKPALVAEWIMRCFP